MPAPGNPTKLVRRAGQVLLAAMALAGCREGSEPEGGTVVLDSAGIVIVENDHTRPALGEGAIRIDETPLVRIGSLDARGPEQLATVRHSAFLADGAIAVIDGQTAEVRIFDAEGRHVRSVGGEGEGPGEFRSPWQVYAIAGDSLLVVDLYRAVSVFGPDGRYTRSFVPAGVSGESQGPPRGMFADGSLLFMTYQQGDRPEAGLYRTRVELVRIGLRGELVHSFGLFDHGTGRAGEGEYVFGPQAAMVPTGSDLLYAPGDRFEIRRIDPNDRTIRLIRLDIEPEPVTEAHRDAWMDMLIRNNPNTAEETLRQVMTPLQSPARFPHHGELQVDDRGYLWVREYVSLGVYDPRRWHVFDEEGRYLGPVRMPAGLSLHEVRGDRVLGRWVDDLDVEYVSVHRIEGLSR